MIRFLIRRQGAEEAGQDGGVVTAAVEHRAHPVRCQPGLIQHRGVGVRTADLFAEDGTLAVQSGKDRLDGVVRQIATEGIDHLTGGERFVGCP